MRRVISIWLPRWPIDRLRRSRKPCHAGKASGERADPAPFALVSRGRHGQLLFAVGRRAEAAGLRPGMRLTDARAQLPGLVVQEADPEADRRGLLQLARWCGRFTPWTAPDGGDGLLLDITGCAHLFGGEAAMCREIPARLGGLGFESRCGLAGTPGAAWALARFAPEGRRIAASGSEAEALGPLPVEALRIAPTDVRLLRRLGLKNVEALNRLPRSALVRRFNAGDGRASVLSCLDRALGRASEPVSPLTPPPVHVRQLALPEPVQGRDQLGTVLVRLMNDLLSTMERDCSGVRRLALWCFRVDGEAQSLEIETARATRDRSHLLHLFDLRLDSVDAGLGIDLVALHAVRVETQEAEQLSLDGRGLAEQDVGRLLDRLHAHLGHGTVRRLERVERYLPERAERAVPAGTVSSSWKERPALACRPFRLFDRPEPVKVTAETPDGPPVHFVWRRRCYRVARTDGPERIEPEWWASDGENLVRDYYRVEDGDGRRYWLYRAGRYGDAQAGAMPPWYLHGLFG